MSTTAHHDVRDLGLSADGVRRIEWADRQMPVLASIRERFAAERPLDGIRISACMHVIMRSCEAVALILETAAEIQNEHAHASAA